MKMQSIVLLFSLKPNCDSGKSDLSSVVEEPPAGLFYRL